MSIRNFRLPWWVRIIVALGTLAAAYYYLPLWEMFYMFIMVCVIPVALLTSIGVIGDATAEAWSIHFNDTVREVGERVAALRRGEEPPPYEEEAA